MLNFEKMEKFEYRAYIKTRVLFGVTATDISNELKSVHDDDAPEYLTVAKWAALFKASRESLEDDPRSGRPITVYIPAIIELVRAIIERNPNATFDEIAAESSINRFTLGEIIHLELRLRN